MLVAQQAFVVVLVHVVWATGGREPCLRDADDVIAGMVRAHARDAGGRALAVGCADDHVHALVELPSTLTLARLVQYMKGKTAYMVNARALLPSYLRWQAGYSALSVSPSARDRVTAYVLDQRAHHAEHTTLPALELPPL